ncbi:MAG: flagellar export protein FliJ [Beijerinckiaceae bacterium]
MKSRDTLVRLRRFQVEEKRRRVAQIEAMIAEFARMAADLDREIALEEQRAGISDTSHFAYPTYARAARTRRDNLLRSAEELRSQLSDAKACLDEALTELTKVQNLEGREKAAEHPAEAATAHLDIAPLGLRAARA